MSEIGKFKASEASSAGESDPKSDTITYELNYRPEHARYQQEAKIGAVEARLHTVEKCVRVRSFCGVAAAESPTHPNTYLYTHSPTHPPTPLPTHFTCCALVGMLAPAWRASPTSWTCPTSPSSRPSRP